MKRRRVAPGPWARPTVFPYQFLVFVLPTLADGFLGLSSRSTVSLRQSVQRLEELVQEHPTSSVVQNSLRANFSDHAVNFVVGGVDEGDFVNAEGDVPDQQLALNKAASSEREQAENIANELEKQLLELARTGGPIPQGLLDQINTLVTKVLKPSVEKHHKEDMALLSHLIKDFESCEKDKGSSSSRADEANRVRSMKSQVHKQCRRREGQAYQETSECNRQLDLTSKVKVHVCNTIQDARVGPADQTATCVDRFCHYLPGENYEMYLRRISAYFEKKLAEFEKAKGACQEMTEQVFRDEQACAKKDLWHKQKRKECDGVQESLERASCAKATASGSSCDLYKACYSRNDAAYKKLKPIIQQREADRKAEWEALMRIECLMGTLSDGQATEAEVQVCVKNTYEVTALDLAYDAVPKELECKVSSQSFSGRQVPCNKEYMQAEYGRLPKGAPPQQCTPCSGPQESFDASSVPHKCRRVKCEWTMRHSCPGQPLGTKGPATVVDGPINGFECCCKHQMWKAVKRRRSDLSAVPIVTVARGGGPKPLGPDFWMTECKKIPKDAQSVKVVMGSVVDYFKPKDHYTFCDMLMAGDKHLWSSDGLEWKKPAYYSSWGRMGGSAENWPKLNVNDDYRAHLSFWGDLNRKGGCCSPSLTKPYDGWGQAFTLSYVPKEGSSSSRKLFPAKVSANVEAAAPASAPSALAAPAPAAPAKPCDTPPGPGGPPSQVLRRVPVLTSGCSKVMETEMRHDGPYDEAYWRKKCLEIPKEAQYVRVTMGDFTDYFKPVQPASMCEMLMHRNMHSWSPDGKTWQAPAFYPSGTFLGGSAMEWPTATPKRRYVSFWGHSYQSGGCCTSSKDSPYQGWSQYFVMEYCV